MVSKKTLIDYDPWLKDFKGEIEARSEFIAEKRQRILNGKTVSEFAQGFDHFGLHDTGNEWIMREWAPNATAIFLVGDFNNWSDDEKFKFSIKDNGEWELKLPKNKLSIGDKYKLHIHWHDGQAYRIPAYATYVKQDEDTKVFDAVVPDTPIAPSYSSVSHDTPLIYEAHVGMASNQEKVGTYNDFTRDVLKRIKHLGYNTVQLMAIAEHPYYGSFGYHVSNFYAPSSRFGTPNELRQLIARAHELGLGVIMDIVHSHAVKNEAEGLSNFAGDTAQYFHAGARGEHVAWDSRTFDYGKPEVVHFLLSNVHYWMKSFGFDGFRFDGVTSMIYTHHGLEKDFTGYDDYFGNDIDIDALTYLTLANDVIHSVRQRAISIAEEMSALPGLCLDVERGGIGFDYRMSMGVPDMWIKTIKEQEDEDWDLGHIFHELTAHRPEEKVVSYAESHDQALVGDKTIIFRLIDKDMYWHMEKSLQNIIVQRGIALHKMIRLITASTHGGGYLNFMGNEFGHPEWIDFPREGNDWSYRRALRRWDLADNPDLLYYNLKLFDKSMLDVVAKLKSDEFHWVTIRQHDNTISYMRDGFIFAFNFSPDVSHESYGIPCPAGGEYEIVLSTDDDVFAGQERIDTRLVYPVAPGDTPEDGFIQVYLPARTAIVLRKK